MASNVLSYDNADDDFIDMELSSYSNFLTQYSSVTSPSHPREFEFQMSSNCLEKDTTTSPADELFYKGKLLPLHLPPRLQMVEKLLQNSNCGYDDRKDTFDDFYSTPLATSVPTPTTTSTPFESCNISPSDSCQVSRELNPNEYFFEYSDDVSGFIGENPKKSWTKKLKLIKQSSLGSKLKASRAYLKSLFGKSGCSDQSCTTAATRVADEGPDSVKKNQFIKYQTPAAQARSFDKEKITEGIKNCHRRSFSMVIKRSTAKKSSSSNSSSSSSGSSSSSSSNDSSGFHELQFLKRSSSSACSEIENSIQGAIAHCKQSQKLFHSRKTLCEVGFHSFSTSSRITICEDEERPELCRG